MTIIDFVQKALANGWTPPQRFVEAVGEEGLIIERIDTSNLAELKSFGIVFRTPVDIQEGSVVVFHTTLFNKYLFHAVYGEEWQTKILDLIVSGKKFEDWLLDA